MKRLIVVLFLFTIIFDALHENKAVIPKESIRFRIIANSNKMEDQILKWKISKELVPYLNIEASSIDNAKDEVAKKIVEIENIIKKYTNDYQINYGNNYFPSKVYNDVMYSAGNYESVVISLGSGVGDNWWCVMYPPLCLLEGEYSESDKIEYTTLVRKIINKYS